MNVVHSQPFGYIQFVFLPDQFAVRGSYRQITVLVCFRAILLNVLTLKEKRDKKKLTSKETTDRVAKTDCD